MVHTRARVSNTLCNEIAIADLKHFQIVVPTTAKLINRAVLSAQIPVPERYYQKQGWLIYNQQLTAHLEALTIDSIFPKDSPFKPIHRLSSGVPISFQVRSSCPLTPQIAAQAAFTTQLPETDHPYYAVFRQVKPRFVKIYPFRATMRLLQDVEQTLVAESRFVSQNQEQLSQVSFYKNAFDL